VAGRSIVYVSTGREVVRIVKRHSARDTVESMSRPAPAVKLTYGDLLALPDDGKRHELIDGVHYVMTTPALRHQRVAARVGISMTTFVDAHGLGEVFFLPVDILLSPYDVVEPDLLFVSAERVHLLQERNISGPPDLVGEVLSPSTRRKDRVLKRRLYERAGVREYWIMDPVQNVIRVHRLEPAGYGEGQELSAAACDSLTTPLLPGWSLPLAALFA
jgi:Uma2 family endonuclease